MKIRTELSCFLGRKKTNLEKFCKAMGVTSYSGLCGLLDDLSVEHPEQSDVEFLNKRKSVPAAAPPETSQAPETSQPKFLKKARSAPGKRKQNVKKSK